MLRGLWILVWVEIKIFLREPLGALGTIGTPVALYLILGRISQKKAELAEAVPIFSSGGLPILAILLIAIGNVLSLTAIISIYREGGILKRLKATPLRPQTILAAQVIVKLLLSAATLALLVLAGKNLVAGQPTTQPLSFALAMLFSLVCILSMGFVIASIVPTARFAQPLGSLLLYPMLFLSGLFFPLEKLPPGLKIFVNLSPLTHAVSLLQGIWAGDAFTEHLASVGALVLTFVICTALSGKIFRWE